MLLCLAHAQRGFTIITRNEEAVCGPVNDLITTAGQGLPLKAKLRDPSWACRWWDHHMGSKVPNVNSEARFPSRPTNSPVGPDFGESLTLSPNFTCPFQLLGWGLCQF